MNVAARVMRQRTLSMFASSARSRWSSSSVSNCWASLSGAIRPRLSPAAPMAPALVAHLAPGDLSHGLERVNLAHGLVWPKANDPRKAHRVSRLVSFARLDLVEGHLDDGVRHDRTDAPVVVDGVRLEILRHLGDLFVRQPGVGLADVREALAVADGERVVGQDTAALAVSPFDRRHDHVQRAQRALHLEPFHAAPAGPVGRPRVLDHQALISAATRRGELALETGDELFTCARDALVLREKHGGREWQRAKDLLTLGERNVEQRATVAFQDVEGHEAGGQFRSQLVGDILAPEPRLE